jgi:hypothetical protein
VTLPNNFYFDILFSFKSVEGALLPAMRDSYMTKHRVPSLSVELCFSPMIYLETDEEAGLPPKIVLITTGWRSLAISLRLCLGARNHEELLMNTNMEDGQSAFFMLDQGASHAPCQMGAGFAPDIYMA